MYHTSFHQQSQQVTNLPFFDTFVLPCEDRNFLLPRNRIAVTFKVSLLFSPLLPDSTASFIHRKDSAENMDFWTESFGIMYQDRNVYDLFVSFTFHVEPRYMHVSSRHVAKNRKLYFVTFDVDYDLISLT